MLAWLRLARVFRKLAQAAAEDVQGHHLTPARFHCLARIGGAEGLNQQELAESLAVTKGNVCQLLDRLEAEALVVRRQQGRANLLYLTSQGRRLFAEVVPAHEAFMARQFESLTAGEQRELLRCLRKLDHALD